MDCDHFIGLEWDQHEGNICVYETDEFRPYLFDEFSYCPRCGIKLLEEVTNDTVCKV